MGMPEYVEFLDICDSSARRAARYHHGFHTVRRRTHAVSHRRSCLGCGTWVIASCSAATSQHPLQLRRCDALDHPGAGYRRCVDPRRPLRKRRGPFLSDCPALVHQLGAARPAVIVRCWPTAAARVAAIRAVRHGRRDAGSTAGPTPSAPRAGYRTSKSARASGPFAPGLASVRNAHATASVWSSPAPATSAAVQTSRTGYDQIAASVFGNAVSTLTPYAAT